MSMNTVIILSGVVFCSGFFVFITSRGVWRGLWKYQKETAEQHLEILKMISLLGTSLTATDGMIKCLTERVKKLEERLTAAEATGESLKTRIGNLEARRIGGRK